MEIPIEVVKARGESYFERAFGLLSSRNYDDALPFFDKAVKEIPYHAEAWLWRGSIMFELGNYEDCIESFDIGLKIEPRFADQIRYGLTLGDPRVPGRSWGPEDLERYTNYFSNPSKANPDDANSWYIKGIGLCSLKKISEAISCFEHVLKLQHDNFRAWCHLGGMRSISVPKRRGIGLGIPNEIKLSIKAYENALSIKREPDVLVNQGLAFVAARKPKLALTLFDQAISMDPTFGYGWLQKGIVLVKMKKRKEADQCFEQALKANPCYSWEYADIIDEWRPGPFDWD